jgi:hemerythrin-like metal-binding protein
MHPKYVLGIPEIDDQHSTLFDMCYCLKSSIESDFQVLKVIVDLYEYALTHLKYEESLLTYWQGYNKHKEQHLALTYQLDELFAEYNSAKTPMAKRNMAVKFLNFMCDWLNVHVLVEDRQYVEFLLPNTTQ